jgi:outer membrane protein
MGALVIGSTLAVLGYNGFSEPQQAPVRLAYINSNEVIAETPGASDAQATFDREMARWQAEVKVLEDSLQQMITTYEQQQVMLSPQARQDRQQEIMQKQLEYQQRAADLQQVAQRRQAELVQPIFDKISSALKDIRAERGYTMIFDASAGALLAADTTLDVTALVIEYLRAQQEAGGDTEN